MARASSVKSFTEGPCLCLQPMSSKTFSPQSLCFANNAGRRRHPRNMGLPNLSSTFLDAWHQRQLSAKMLSCCTSRRTQKLQSLIIVDELGGQYEDTFNDVKMEIINYFTFKAVKTVLEQLYEMNPPQYAWFNNFVADNVPNTAARFLQTLVKERQELAERVMITRLTLYGRWMKKCNHGEIYKEISEENLELMRERLRETIIWPSDDTSSDKKTD